MKIELKRLGADEWARFAENAHLATFGEFRSKGKDRIDFALLAIDEHDTPIGYMTVKELDSETVYWQFGGALPDYKGTNTMWHAYVAASAYCKERYKRVFTYIENTNPPMLKFAMKLGFRIIGIRNFGKHILLEHLLEY